MWTLGLVYAGRKAHGNTANFRLRRSTSLNMPRPAPGLPEA